jgi:D-arabinose 1-dehydrogenase-like Zn-dependent alcohol dehydrogenase
MDITFDVFHGDKDGRIVSAKTTRTLEPSQVFVRITHSGLCGTDLHYLHSGQVLGHEGIGIVEQVGRDVTTRKIGDRVGLGYLHKVCGICKNCLTGMSFQILCIQIQQHDRLYVTVI